MSSIASKIDEYINKIKAVLEKLPKAQLEEFLQVLLKARIENNTIFVFGNGGSASTASHIATGIGRGVITDGLPRFRIISLPDNVAYITAIANDYDYDNIFSEQLISLARPKDIAIAVSTSGTSSNILKAVSTARTLGMITVALTGDNGRKLQDMCDLSIVVASSEKSPIEDAHMVINHLIQFLIIQCNEV